MTIEILNYLHRKGFRKTNSFLSKIGYRVKGFGHVKTVYHPGFRAYEYKVKEIVYMSAGPGWAYCYDYLKKALQESYCYYYMPQPGNSVIDIGAGLGEESVIFALLVGERGAVHAIEANPVSFAGLKYMRDQNKLTWMVPHQLAIYRENGSLSIEDNENDYITNTIHENSGKPGCIQVPAKTLDTLVYENNITRIDFLKSNIEGAEKYLIEGMSNSINIIRNVCICCHDFRHIHHQDSEFYVTKKLVTSFLSKQGFEVKTRNTGNQCVDDYIYGRNVNLK